MRERSHSCFLHALMIIDRYAARTRTVFLSNHHHVRRRNAEYSGIVHAHSSESQQYLHLDRRIEAIPASFAQMNRPWDASCLLFDVRFEYSTLGGANTSNVIIAAKFNRISLPCDTLPASLDRFNNRCRECCGCALTKNWTTFSPSDRYSRSFRLSLDTHD